MTDKYKTFWVYDKGGDRNGPYKYNCWPHKVENHYNNNPVIEVIERRALDEAAALLKEYKDCYGTPIGLNERCDEFLKGLGEG